MFHTITFIWFILHNAGSKQLDTSSKFKYIRWLDDVTFRLSNHITLFSRVYSFCGSPTLVQLRLIRYQPSFSQTHSFYTRKRPPTGSIIRCPQCLQLTRQCRGHWTLDSSGWCTFLTPLKEDSGFCHWFFRSYRCRCCCYPVQQNRFRFSSAPFSSCCCLVRYEVVSRLLCNAVSPWFSSSYTSQS